MKITKSSSEYLLDTSRDYSMYVCQNRAIPSASDGLKDGQRKALWLIRNMSDKIKTVSLSGLMIQSGLFLHGDASASDAISKLAGPYLNNIPLLDGIGTFGTRVAPVDGIGAPRYTYVKKSKAAQAFLYRDLDIVPLKENYDGSTMEPVTFLPIIPLVLLNGISGIAVGWATNILPRSPKDLITATLAAIDGKKIKKLVPHFSYLDVSVKELEDGSWEFAGKAEVVDSTIAKITELPPDMSLEKFRDRLDAMEEEGKIQTYEDNSTKVIDITVRFKRGDLKSHTNESLIDFFKLRSKRSEKIVVIDWNAESIREYETAEQLVVDFVDWRFKQYVRRYAQMLVDAQYELKFWQGVKACFDQKLPDTVLNAKNKKEIEQLVEAITKDLDESQIDKIASFPTYRWAKDAYEDVKKKIKELQDSAKEYKDLLDHPEKIKTIFRDEVSALKV